MDLLKLYQVFSGFNCGEAVNFATGDWFTLGALASHRYALFNKMPLLPYEELLCKEAKLLFDQSTKDRSFSIDDSSAYRCIAISFVRLILFHHQVRSSLLALGAQSLHSPDSEGTIVCNICKRDCYVGYVMCNCHEYPICFYHGMILLLTSKKNWVNSIFLICIIL